MFTDQKLCAIRNLVEIGQDYSELAEDSLRLIGKVANPLGAAKAVGNAPTVDEMVVAKNSGKISAIKAHRTRTGMGLKESKDAIEESLALLGISVGTGPLLY